MFGDLLKKQGKFDYGFSEAVGETDAEEMARQLFTGCSLVRSVQTNCEVMSF